MLEVNLDLRTLPFTLYLLGSSFDDGDAPMLSETDHVPGRLGPVSQVCAGGGA